MITKKWILYGGFMCLGLVANAQGVQFVASAPTVVSVGEQFQLVYEVNARGSNLVVPEMKNFNVLAGPSTMSSSSVSIVNGRMTKNVSYSFTYLMQANKAGKFIIGPAEITVDGKKYTSNSLNIEVAGSGSSSSSNRGQGTSGSNSGSSSVSSNEVEGRDLFVVVSVDKKSLYQGEALLATIKVYSKLDLSGFDNMKFPTFSGFFSQEIETPTQITLQRENVNGQVYAAGVIKKVVLFPQRSGDIVIDPFELTCIAQVPVRRRSQSIFDDFFGPSYKEVKQKVVSKPITISVKPLPEGKPQSFNGTVGNITLKSSIDKTQAKTNDAITLKIALSGTGNLKLTEAPQIKFPADFESYEPKVSSNLKINANGSTGTKTFEYLLIPRQAGDYKIAPIDYSYFDVTTKSYKTLQTPEYTIHVEKDANDHSNALISSVEKEDVKYIGKDIRFIKKVTSTYRNKGSFLVVAFPFYLVYIIAALLFVALLFVRKKIFDQNANVVLVRSRRASKMAKKRMKIAEGCLKANQNERFYEECLKALWGYLSDKLNIPLADLSKDTIEQSLNNKGVDAELVNKLLQIVAECEFARYAPMASHLQANEIYKQSIEIISDLEETL
jgi:hypothetical protein